MPHISFDYSPNIDDQIDLSAFCVCLRDAALRTGLFPLAGVRVRGIRCDVCLIADGGENYGFVDISVRLREGRSLEARQKAVDEIFAAAKDFMKPLLVASPFALSLEMRDIDARLSPKESSLRRYCKGGQGG